MVYRHGGFPGRGGENQSLQQVIHLGTGAVTTGNHIVGVVPQNCRVTGVYFHGQSAPTASSLTIEVFERTSAGAAGNTLQASATDIDFGSAALAKTGVAASLTTTQSSLRLTEGLLIEATVTANTVNPGPGDLVVEIDFEPRH